MESNKDYSVFGRHILYFIGVAVVTQLIGFIQFPIITKSIGASSYGIFSIISTTISLLTPFAVIGIRSSIIRFLAAEKNKSIIRNDFASLYTLVFVNGLILSAILFLFANLIATEIMNDVSAAFFVKIAAILILLYAIFDVSIAFFRSRHSLGLQAIFVLFNTLLQFTLIVLFINFHMDLTGVILALVISGLVMNITSLVIIIKKYGFAIPNFKNVIRYIKWGLPLTPNAILFWIINISDRYMVSFFMGLTSAGIYSAAYTIGNYTSFLLSPIGLVLYPNIIKSYDEGKYEETRKYFKYSLKYLMMITIPAAFGLSVLAQPILRILTSQEFITGSIIIPIIAASAIFFCIYQISIYIIHITNKTYITFRLLIIAAIINIGLNFLLIPIWGIIGAAIATLAAYLILGILAIIITRKYFKFDLSLPFIGKCILSSIVMGTCVWLINPKSLLVLIISIIAGALIYFIVLFLTRGFTRNEMNFFIHFVKDHMAKLKIGSK